MGYMLFSLGKAKFCSNPDYKMKNIIFINNSLEKTLVSAVFTYISSRTATFSTGLGTFSGEMLVSLV